MNSQDLAKHGFTRWAAFNLAEEGALLATLPSRPGVYALRWSRVFGRFRGESDIVYIGSAINARGLRKRIRHYFRPGKTQRTSQRIRQLLGLLNDLEFSWVERSDPVEARSLERKLLAEYADDHIELPPLDRQGGDIWE